MSRNKKHKEVFFYYPKHFNRSVIGINPFFEPLVEACLKNDISYVLFEEPDRHTDKPANNLARKFGTAFFFILVLRKILPLFLFRDWESRERYIGKVLNYFTLGAYQANNYITLSNSLGGILRGINPAAQIFDFQHGIITSTQPGYFRNGKASSWISSNKKEILVYGKAFRELMINTDAEYYSGKVHVIGSPEMLSSHFSKGNNVLVSLQILESENVPQEWLQAQVALLEGLFRAFKKTDSASKTNIYLRHHPRSSRTYNLERLFVFPFVREFDQSPDSFQISLHVTFFSTSAFEFAQEGIPTLFLANQFIPEGHQIFHKEFNYPYSKLDSLEAWLTAIKSDSCGAISKNVIEWASNFYEPFNEEAFIKIISKNE